jgi:hypothetical protein
VRNVGLQDQKRLETLERQLTSFDRSVRGLIEQEVRTTVASLMKPDLQGSELDSHIRNLRSIKQNGYDYALFEGLLRQSTHWEDLKTKPQNYGLVLDDRGKMRPDGVHIFIDADKTRILELTPFAFHALLAKQRGDGQSSTATCSSDVWAFPELVGKSPAVPVLALVAELTTKAERWKKKPSHHKIGDVMIDELGMKFAWVPPGQSWLGGGGGKPGITPFTLSLGCWCGVYSVTQDSWKMVMGDNPSHYRYNPDYPVESVSWRQVQKCIKELNVHWREVGLMYRLPTSEEWEYIYRGGPISQALSAYHFYFARSKTDLTPAPTNDLSSTQANFHGDYPVGSAAKGPYLQRPCKVGSYLPNPLGIYDLHGNVYEWTSSEEGLARVFRGGSWYFAGKFCTASHHSRDKPSYADQFLGFRLLAVPSGKLYAELS